MQPSATDRPPRMLSQSVDSGSRVPLIVLSHLRWGFVFQRPQHLLTRLSRDFDVYFIEEPVFQEGRPGLQVTRREGNVEVLTPHTPLRDAGFHDEQLAALRTLLLDFVIQRRLSDPLVWLYTPMALPLVATLEPRAIIYDCMDDLASFKFAPPQLLSREHELMQIADIVTTGGPSLYEARKGLHANIHCLPSAVDAAHFSPSRLDEGTAEAGLASELHRDMRRPRLGFFGVIDERLDIELLCGLADRRPDWQIVMVGPVVKIDPATLPKRPNIHWVGMQSYEALPHLLSHWDVCLLPFALNESTRFISPTKTLEYLAGGKPVVTTPIHDVVSLYGSVVRFGADAGEFVAAIEQTLAQSPAERARWGNQARAVVDGCTWDATAARIAALLHAYARNDSSHDIVLAQPLLERSASKPADPRQAKAAGAACAPVELGAQPLAS